MTKPATSIEYATMPVAIVVGGTEKASTIPLSATGNEATLKDMIIWPSAIAIIGTHDSRASDDRSFRERVSVMANSRMIRYGGGRCADAVHSSGFDANRSIPSCCDRNFATN